MYNDVDEAAKAGADVIYAHYNTFRQEFQDFRRSVVFIFPYMRKIYKFYVLWSICGT